MPLVPIKSGRYISIKSDGRFHEVVSKDTEGAVLREYKLKDGTEGSKWELLYKSVDNVYIKNVSFEPSDYGENILLTLSDGENEVIWSENTGTNFGTDLMKKLPNVIFSEKVSIAPYAFTNEKGKELRGVNIYGQGDKITNFFFDPEKKEELHGFPVPEGDKTTYDSDDWKAHFIRVKKFLVSYIKENIVPLFEKGIEYPEEELGASPF